MLAEVMDGSGTHGLERKQKETLLWESQDTADRVEGNYNYNIV